jgi:hypothetical protein
LAAIAGGTVADGTHTLHLASTDGSGNVSTFDLTFVLATQTPVLSAALSDTAAIKADGTTIRVSPAASPRSTASSA